MEPRDMLWAAAKAFIAAVLLTPIIRDIFHAYNVVDRPGVRKVHAYPVPRLGGIAVGVAYLAAWLTLPEAAGPADSSAALAWRVLPGAAVIFLTGILDDFFDVPPVVKLIGQLAAAAAVFFSGLRMPGSALASFPATVFWILLSTNAFNLIDGLDGLCAGLALVASSALFAAGASRGNPPLEAAALPLMGALLGFLCFNFSRATMFLGDSGALLIGYLVGCLGMVEVEGTPGRSAILLPLLAISIPVADLSLSVARRLLGGRSVFAADRGHIHHRLLERGWKPTRVAVVLYLWGGAGAVLGFWLSDPSWGAARIFVAGGLAVAIGVGVRALRYTEFIVAASLVRGEFRQILQAKVQMRNLAESLQRSGTEDEWWSLVTRAAQEAGWIGVRWNRGQAAPRERTFQSESAAWSFCVSLGDNETLQVDGAARAARPASDLVAFAEVVRESLADQRPKWRQPALS